MISAHVDLGKNIRNVVGKTKIIIDRVCVNSINSIFMF